jgi:hypothetical protein
MGNSIEEISVVREFPDVFPNDLSMGNSIEEISVVREFPDVFPNDLSRMPPKRDIEFKIEL